MAQQTFHNPNHALPAPKVLPQGLFSSQTICVCELVWNLSVHFYKSCYQRVQNRQFDLSFISRLHCDGKVLQPDTATSQSSETSDFYHVK